MIEPVFSRHKKTPQVMVEYRLAVEDFSPPKQGLIYPEESYTLLPNSTNIPIYCNGRELIKEIKRRYGTLDLGIVTSKCTIIPNF